MAQDSGDFRSNLSSLHQLIRGTRQLLRAAWTATGLGLTVGLGLVLLVAVTLADLASAFGEWLRLVGLLLIVVPSFLAFANGVVRPLFRRMSSRFVARRIESTLPGIHNRLVSVMDLDSNKQQTFSMAFVMRLITEAIDRVKNFKPWSVVDKPALRRAGMFALLGTIVFVTAFGVFSDRLPTALARIFSPFADIPPATGVLFEVTPGTAKVLRGEPIEFVATVTKGSVGNSSSDRLRLELKPIEGENAGKTLWHDMRLSQTAGVWTFKLPAYDSSFEYRVHGGGTWTKLATVTMLERPRLVGLQAAVHFPSYMQIPEPKVNPPDVADVTGPVGSSVELAVNVEGDASTGEIQFLREEVKTLRVSELDRQERPWFNDSLPKGHAVEGNWEWQPALDPNKPTPFDSINAPIPGGKWHSHPAAAGLSYHLFHSAAIPFEVHFGDVLFVEVFVPAEQAPEELMLQVHDGQSWDRRAFWGADKIGMGTLDTPSRRRIGELPKSGEWVRLEVPARQLDLEGQSIRGLNFTQFSGKCLWGRAGAMQSATREVREFVVAEAFPLKLKTDVETSDAAAKPKTVNAKHFATVREAHRWTGTFPINGDGWYRVELKNEIGAANLPMKEARITSTPDNPPQIMIERPGMDLVLSEPVKVPIVIASFDDFGLGELVLSVQRGDAGFVGRPVKTYSTITRGDTALVMLDLSNEGLKNGDVLKYRAEVRDRKGQSAQTQDYQIRIASNDPNAADKKLAQLEKKEDEFAKKLDQLIAEQAKVQEKLEKIAEKYEPVTDKIEAAQEAVEVAAAEQAAQEQANKNDPNVKDQPKADSDPKTKDQPKPQEAAKTPDANKPPMSVPELRLDPATEQQLNELKKELSQLQQEEMKNAETAKQLNEELKQLAKEAEGQQLLPPELQREMAALSEAFDEAATQPLKNLVEEIKKSADAKAQDPMLDKLEARADQVQENLEALKDRVEALRDAQKEAQQDAAMALEELRREMTEQAGELTAQELEQLRAAIEALREKLQNLASEEAQMLEFTPEAPESLLPEIANKQRHLERRADKELAQTKELQKRDDYKALKQKQNKQTQKPQDANDEAAMQEALAGNDPLNGDEPPEMTSPDDNGNEAPMSDAGMPEDNGDFQPAIADAPQAPPQKGSDQSPVTAKKKQALNAKDKPKVKAPETSRERLEQRAAVKLDQLQKADESLAADQRALDELLGEIGELLNSENGEMANADSPMPSDSPTPDQPVTPMDGQPVDGQAAADANDSPISAEKAAELRELLQSAKAQKAMQMAARLQAMQAGDTSDQPSKNQKLPNNQPPPLKSSPKPKSGLEGDSASQFAMEGVLKDLDPNTRSLILKMQPRVREELLQSLREEGPEGYQRFIRGYFKRLTNAGQSSKARP